MAGVGFEPTTLGLWAPQATRLLYPAIKICRNLSLNFIVTKILQKVKKMSF